MASGKEWAQRVIIGNSFRAAAQRIGIPQNTLNRQVSKDQIPHEVIVKIARAFGANPLDGLIANGLITSEEVARFAGAVSLCGVSDEALLEEIARRLREKHSKAQAYE